MKLQVSFAEYTEKKCGTFSSVEKSSTNAQCVSNCTESQEFIVKKKKAFSYAEVLMQGPAF